MSQTAPVIAVNIPTTVESWQWDGTGVQSVHIVEWIRQNGGHAERHPYDNRIVLGDDYDSVIPGDWVIRDKFGEFFPLRDADYRATYQSVLNAH